VAVAAVILREGPGSPHRVVGEGVDEHAGDELGVIRRGHAGGGPCRARAAQAASSGLLSVYSGSIRAVFAR
jgi:hypothetical protein